MEAQRGQWEGTGGPWRARRRRAVDTLRAQGRYGPELRDVLPAFAMLVVLACALAGGLALLYRANGAAAPVAIALVLVLVLLMLFLHRRPLARRRRGYYTPEELAELDMAGLVKAVARMLRREGWRVRRPIEPDLPRLVARDAGGRLLEVAFRPVAEPLPGEDPLCAGAGSRARQPLLMVVHRGTFSSRDALWARRRGGVRLVDGPGLKRWAAGTPLRELDGPDGTP
ncbi:hypothetical protein ACIBWG_32650 [Streptomyces griseoaurantiacus]|uniref:hypothetical protein n=1 Tax=Streptomyces TaxID=1883 RepID=UPI0029A97D5C|nr:MULTISPECIES: hypothetical protein [unclassified Streptomyces]MDX3089369.1 hypothetical protein [Streptomyces sp. ME12-02E]MDX3332835.1 hypothetical protein [Streptomyces sp. ME02-6978a]